MAKFFTATFTIFLVCLILMVVSAGPAKKHEEDLLGADEATEGDGDDDHTSKPVITTAKKAANNKQHVDANTKKIAATNKNTKEVKTNDGKKDGKKPPEVKKTDPKKGDAKKTEAKPTDNKKQNKPDPKKAAANNKTPDAKSGAANAKAAASTKPSKPNAKPPPNTTKKPVPQDPLEQILKPLLKMAIIQDDVKNQSKPGSYKLEPKKELSCLTGNQWKSMRDVIKKCSENSTKTKEANIQKDGHDFGFHPEDKQHEVRVKSVKHQMRTEKCFIRNMIANNGSDNNNSPSSEIDTEKMKSLIQQANLADSQKQSAETSLDQCMQNYTLNSGKLRGFLNQMAQNEDKMTDILSKLVDQMLENNVTEISELKELKEFIPLIKGMVCVVKSLTENGCKTSSAKPVTPAAPKNGSLVLLKPSLMRRLPK